MHIFESLLKEALEVQASAGKKFPKLPLISPLTKVIKECLLYLVIS